MRAQLTAYESIQRELGGDIQNQQKLQEMLERYKKEKEELQAEINGSLSIQL